MSEMEERVARAIATSDEPHEPWDNWAERHKETFRAEARAAILALREPTEGMLNAADPGYRGEPLPADMAWQRMIDAALK